MKEARARLLRTVSPGRTVTSADPAVGRPGRRKARQLCERKAV